MEKHEVTAHMEANTIDGRKRTAMYFGDTKTDSFLPWYYEMKENLTNDGLPVTHIGYGTLTKPLAYIRTAKRVEKRYLQAINTSPRETRGMELYYITEGVEHMANQYSFSTGMYVDIWKHKFSRFLCADVSMDFSLLDRLDFDKYCQITRKYSDWEQEVIFDCSEYDTPLSYAWSQNPEVFREIKILSDIKR